MRPVLPLDVAAAARVLVRMPEGERECRCRQMLCQADAADRYVRSLGKLHPHWGNGTLLAVARQWPWAAERSFDDPTYRACTLLVLQQLDERRPPGSCKQA